jgi:hypothetical protein
MYRKLYLLIALCHLSVGLFAQNLTTDTVLGTSFCPCAPVDVVFTTTGTINTGNQYTVELSDASGSFANPDTIGFVISTDLTDTIAATIPCSAITGTGYRIRVLSTDVAETGADNGVDLEVKAQVTAAISISVSPSGPVCAGTSVTYSATLTNGGATPGYYWQKNGVYVTSTATYTNNTPANGDDVFCTLTPSVQCPATPTVNSNHIIQTVNPNLTPSVSIVSNASPGGACAGANVTFTATPVNGGTTPAYQWKKNGSNVGTNSNTYSDNTLAQGDIITVVMTSNETCLVTATATSNAITMNIGSPVTPSVSINPIPGSTICNGVAVNFVAVPVNGGISPTYEWKLNGVIVSTAPAFSNPGTLVNGDVITVTMTSNAPCPSPATANNTVTMTVVTPTAPTVSIVSNAGNPLCSGTSVTFTATPGNAGTAPKYQWKRNGTNVGTNSPTYTSSALANFDVITCVITSDAFCPLSTTSNAITMNITPTLTPSATIVSSVGNPTCLGAALTFSATPYGGGTNPSYQWKIDGVNTGTNSPSLYNAGTLTAGTHTIVCEITTNYVCPASPTGTGTLNFVVNPILAPSVTIASPSVNSNGHVCGNASVTFTATPVNGGSAPQYQWKKNGLNIATGVSYPAGTSLVNGDVITCEMTSNGMCVSPAMATSSAITIAHYPVTSTSVTISSPYGPVACQGLNVNFIATPSNPGTTPQYQWKKNGTNIAGATSPTYTTAISGGESIVCEMRSSTPCATPVPAISNTLNMTVSPIVKGSVNMYVTNDSVACEGEPFLFTSYFTNGGTNPAFRWFKNGVAVPGANQSTYSSNSLVNNDVITCEMTSNAVCVFPVLSSPISVEVLAVDTPEVAIVGNKNAMGYTFYATMVNGGATPSYQWRKNGIDIPGATSDIYTVGNLLPNDKISVTAGTSLQCAYPLFVLSNTILVSEVTSVKSVASNVGSLQLFPNPNEGKFTIKASVKTINNDANVEVLNAVGQVVYRNTVPVQGAEFNANIDLGSAAAGMYMVRLNIDGQVSTLRFVVK